MRFLIRTIESAIYPVGLVWLVLTFAGIVYYRKKMRRTACFLFGLSAFLWLIGATPIPSWMIARLERPFANATVASAPNADAIIVLGGVINPSSHDPFGLSITSAADRVIAGVELLRLQKAPALVFGGGAAPLKGKQDLSEGLRVEHWLKTWNVATGEIIGLPACRNTHQEAERVQNLMAQRKWTNVLLVTSAFHMARAKATFEKIGVKVQPVACDFEGLPAMEGEATSFRLIPIIDHIEKLTLYLHEVLGWYYYMARGWV
jgi:uncharacterized SAM-binding protein YcdF (DUF218 family)